MRRSIALSALAASIAGIAAPQANAQTQTPLVLSVHQENLMRPLWHACQKDFNKNATPEEQTACAQQLYRTLGPLYGKVFNAIENAPKNQKTAQINKAIHGPCAVVFGLSANNNQVLYAAELGMIKDQKPIPFSDQRNQGYLGYMSATLACEQAMIVTHNEDRNFFDLGENNTQQINIAYEWANCSVYSLLRDKYPQAAEEAKKCTSNMQVIGKALGELKVIP